MGIDWIEAAERDARDAVARMPPEMRCAAARSGTTGSLNVAAIAAHENGTCPCALSAHLEANARAALRAECINLGIEPARIEAVVDDLIALAHSEGQRLRLASLTDLKEPS